MGRYNTPDKCRLALPNQTFAVDKGYAIRPGCRYLLVRYTLTMLDPEMT